MSRVQRPHSAVGYAARITRDVWQHPSNRGRRARAVVRAVEWQASKRVLRRPRDIRFWGLTLRCYPDSNSASNVMYFGEHYDPDEMRFMERYLRPGDAFVDVGANIGTYTLAAAALVGPRGRIDAFEPFPPVCARLRENVALNRLDNVTVHEMATGADTGTVEFLADYDVSNCVRNDVDRVGNVVAVPQDRLDAALEGGRYALGKIDVEGMETASFRGAAEHLRTSNPPVWQIEVLDHQLRKYGSSATELLVHLAEAGFDIAGYESDGAISFEPESWRSRRNVLAIARSAREDVLERLASANGRASSEAMSNPGANNPDANNRDVFNRTAVVDAYSRDTHGLSAAERLLFRRHILADTAVLDLGVGTGRTTEYLSDVAARYVGVDYAPEMIVAARERHPGADLRVGNATDLSPFGDATFDVVVFSLNGIDYLHPDTARLACLREVRRVLRPGGVWIFSTHNPRAVIRPVREPSGSRLHDLGASAYMTARRLARTLPTAAFRTGSGYVLDPVKGGLVTHAATPTEVIRETESFGFARREVVAGDHPRRASRARSPWYYYAFTAR